MSYKTTCPHCGHQALGLTRKLLLGPAGSTRCRHCGRGIGVSWFAFFAFIGIAIITAVVGYNSSLFGLEWWVAGALLMVLVQGYLIPLEER